VKIGFCQRNGNGILVTTKLTEKGKKRRRKKRVDGYSPLHPYFVPNKPRNMREREREKESE
jgi:hypothetical protein